MIIVVIFINKMICVFLAVVRARKTMRRSFCDAAHLSAPRCNSDGSEKTKRPAEVPRAFGIFFEPYRELSSDLVVSGYRDFRKSRAILRIGGLAAGNPLSDGPTALRGDRFSLVRRRRRGGRERSGLSPKL